jgi:hypothetical protein
MLVEKFAAALNDGDNAKYPFIVGTVNGVPTVSMNSALIGDTSIGTLKLAGESVTVPRFIAFTNSTYHSRAETQVFAYSLPLPAAASVLVSCKAYATTMNSALDWRAYYRVYVNGVERFVRSHGY